jgi:hypothetical protein
MRQSIVLQTLLAAVVLVGCSKPAPSVEVADSAPPAMASAVPSSAPSAPAIQPVFSVGDKLQSEQRDRPTGTPKGEDVYAAFEKAGFALTEKQQHVASVFGAKFCVGAKTDNDMAFSVCEYVDEPSAKAGRDVSLKTLAMVPNREIFVNKKTTLTVRQPAKKTPASEAASKKAAQIFGKL